MYLTPTVLHTQLLNCGEKTSLLWSDLMFRLSYIPRRIYHSRSRSLSWRDDIFVIFKDINKYISHI